MSSEEQKEGIQAVPLGFDMNDLFFMSSNSNYSTEPKELYYQLVSQLLDIERVVITAKMIPFLSNPGVCETIISFITRVPEGESNDYLRERDRNEISMKKSFNAVYLILNRSNSGMKTFISNSTSQYLELLLQAFLPHSNANLNHIKMVIAWSMENFPEFKKQLINSNFISLALNYLHETPVVELLLAIISNSLAYSEEREKIVKKKLFRVILDRVIDPENAESAKITSEFLSRLINELSTISGSEVFLPINDGDIVELMLTPIFKDGFPAEQQKVSLTVFYNLYTKIHETPATQPGFMNSRNSLSAYKETINNYVSNHLKTLCEILTRSRNPNNYNSDSYKYSSYTVKSAISEFRLQLIEIITQNLQFNEQLLNEIPDTFWGTLVHWYFDNCNNSIYLIKFSRIFQTILFSRNEEVFRKFTKTKFLTRVIDTFHVPEFAACKCFSILICNQLRLFSDANPTSGVKHYLSSHGSWASFLPILRTETELQVLKPICPIKSFVPQSHPPPLLSPNNANRTVTDGDGIDLGSSYAFSIGIDTLPSQVVVPPSPCKKKKKKKKSSIHTLSPISNNDNGENSNSVVTENE